MPPDPDAPVEPIRATVRAALAALPPDERVLLAVSGGRDSMVLLDAAVEAAPGRVAGVATFDHGTGAAATAAATLVRGEAERRALPVVVGQGVGLAPTEAAWREARWRFLRAAARELGAARVATGHTRDDQVETVAMRVLRDAGARGLAALAAPSRHVLRPLLDVGRGDVSAYAAARGLPFVEDPGNASPRWLRNRLRHELLPALERASPGLAATLLHLGREAAAWREAVDAFIACHVAVEAAGDGGVRVALASLRGYDAEALAVLWPAIAARGGVRLDRRGTRRLVEFTTRRAAEVSPATGARIQLAGGAEVEARRGELVLRPVAGEGVRPGAGDFAWGASERALAGGVVQLGSWIFRPDSAVGAGREAWGAVLPVGEGGAGAVTVRAWRPGDRMAWRGTGSGGGSARRVKRFLADAGIPGRERPGWPVVLVGGEIVWIPGVRRSDAATVRPGEPGLSYVCERIRTRGA